MKILIAALGSATQRNMSLIDLILYGLCVQHYIQNQKFWMFFFYIVLSVGVSVLAEKLYKRLSK